MAIGSAIYALCQWAILACLAKLGTPAAVGQWSLAFAITAPIMLLLNLNLRALQATDARDEFNFPTYLSLRLWCAAIAVAVSAGIALWSGYDGSTRNAILAIALAKGAEAVSDIVYGLLQKNERIPRVAGSMMLRGALSLASVAGVFSFTRDVVASTVALTVVWMAMATGFDLRAASRELPISLDLDRGRLVRLFWTAIPLGLVMVMINLNANLPVYFLSWKHGPDLVGIYSAINYIGIAASMVAAAIAQTAAPRFARMHVAGQVREGRALLGKLMLAGVGGGVLALAASNVLGEQALRILYTEEYAEHVRVLEILMLACGLGIAASFVGVVLTARRQLRVMVPINVAAISINACLCWNLVPTMGIEGASWSYLISLAFKLCANYTVVTWSDAGRG